MNETITAISSGGQLIFGRAFHEDDNQIALNQPRVFQQAPAANGKGVVNSLVAYVGEPERVTFFKSNIVFLYIPSQKDLINAYIEVTSGIALTKIVPASGALRKPQ